MLQEADSRIPWQENNNKRASAVYTLVQALQQSHSNTKKTKIDGKTHSYLTRQFKKAELGRSKSHRFMAAIAKAIGIIKPEARIEYASGKEWDRAREKLLAENRNLNDLERGRIKLSSIGKYNELKKLLRSMTKSGQLNGISIEGVSILPDKLDDYLEKAREESGWAGALNMDLDIDLGKGRRGRFELQFMPEGYETIEPLSHRLFNMIRILKELPDAYKKPEDQEIQDALILANHAMYIEIGHRTGFIDARKDEAPKFTQEKIDDAFDILDRIASEIEILGGRPFKWKQETIQATTMAKTSLQHIAIAIRNKKELIPSSP